MKRVHDELTLLRFNEGFALLMERRASDKGRSEGREERGGAGDAALRVRRVSALSTER